MGIILTKNEEESLRLAKELAVPSADDGCKFIDTSRIEVIKRELENSKYKLIVNNPIFMLYGLAELDELPDNLLVVSTHIDCLQDKAVFEDNGKRLHGIFDNAITNAAAISLMKSEELDKKIVFAFTGNEENGMVGVDNLVKILNAHDKSFRAIVLDVTEEGFNDKAAFTIENGFWLRKEGTWWYEHIFSEAEKSGSVWRYVSACNEDSIRYYDEDYVTKGIPQGIVAKEDDKAHSYVEADEDESWKYDEYGIACFSLCLPMTGKMHSNKGFDIRKRSYFSYIKMLYYILELEKLGPLYFEMD